jgi:hypothetical protein
MNNIDGGITNNDSIINKGTITVTGNTVTLAGGSVVINDSLVTVESGATLTIQSDTITGSGILVLASTNNLAGSTAEIVNGTRGVQSHLVKNEDIRFIDVHGNYTWDGRWQDYITADDSVQIGSGKTLNIAGAMAIPCSTKVNVNVGGTVNVTSAVTLNGTANNWGVININDGGTVTASAPCAEVNNNLVYTGTDISAVGVINITGTGKFNNTDGAVNSAGLIVSKNNNSIANTGPVTGLIFVKDRRWFDVYGAYTWLDTAAYLFRTSGDTLNIQPNATLTLDTLTIGRSQALVNRGAVAFDSVTNY